LGELKHPPFEWGKEGVQRFQIRGEPSCTGEVTMEEAGGKKRILVKGGSLRSGVEMKMLARERGTVFIQRGTI